MADAPRPTAADDTTFAAELAAYHPRLTSLARRLCWSGTEAEDMVQQAMLKAWAYRDAFKTGTDLGAWLRTILRNEIYSDARRHTRRPTRRFIDEVDDPICPPSQEWAVALADLSRQIGALSGDQAEAIALVGVLGHDHAEAAQIVGCAHGAMKSRVSRGRACLRQMAEA
jgi:RNA polymerase sigma-70 factor (ECF subfamily)